MKPAVICLLALLLAGCAQNSRPTQLQSEIKIESWDVSYKSTRSTGSVLASWKYHLSNPSDQTASGILWLYGLDDSDYQFLKWTGDPLVIAIPPHGEIKHIDEIFFEPGQWDKVKAYRIDWKSLSR